MDCQLFVKDSGRKIVSHWDVRVETALSKAIRRTAANQSHKTEEAKEEEYV